MSAESPLSKVADGFRNNDVALILGTMLGVYVLFAISQVLILPDERLVAGTFDKLRSVTLLITLYSMAVLALNLHWGYAGLFNIGVAGFMAVGGYTFAILTAPPTGSPPGLGLALPIGVVGGILMAAIFGAIVSLPALRLRADYLAIVTVAFSEIIRLSAQSRTFQEFTIAGATVGTGGGSGISFPSTESPIRSIYFNDPADTTQGLTPIGDAVFGFFSGYNIDPNIVLGWTYVLVLAVFVAAFYWLLVRVGNSPFGRLLKAIREDEVVASSLGKDTRMAKIKVFMLGCALMGLAGILWEGRNGYMSPGGLAGTFSPLQTFYIFIALIIGGAGSNTGSVLGAALFVSLLFEGPTTVGRIVSKYLELGSPPNTFASALGGFSSLDPMPLLAYSVSNISTLRFVLLGVVLVVLVQRRPEGLLGHRKEIASSVDLMERDSDEPTRDAEAATDGGGGGE